MNGCECKPDAKRKRDSAHSRTRSASAIARSLKNAKRKRDSAHSRTRSASAIARSLKNAKRKRDSAQPQEKDAAIKKGTQHGTDQYEARGRVFVCGRNRGCGYRSPVCARVRGSDEEGHQEVCRQDRGSSR